MAILKETDSGMKVAEVCRKHGISQPTYYNWKSKWSVPLKGWTGNSMAGKRFFRWNAQRRRSRSGAIQRSAPVSTPQLEGGHS